MLTVGPFYKYLSNGWDADRLLTVTVVSEMLTAFLDRPMLRLAGLLSSVGVE